MNLFDKENKISVDIEKRPMSCIFGAKDSESIDTLIDIHCKSNSPFIVDVCHNKGRMWKGSKYTPNLKLDIDIQHSPDIICDFRNIPLQNNSVDIVVFDPPYLPTDGASENASKIYETRFGITSSTALGTDYRQGNNISGCFPAFLKEARRILNKEGIILAKLGDIIHSGKYQWHLVDFINACRNEGLNPDDLRISVPPQGGTLTSSKWKNILHLRRNHIYWIVVKK